MTEESVQIQDGQDTEQSNLLGLQGQCTTCFGPDGVLFIGKGNQDCLCSKCAHQRALWDVGYQQLLSQVREVAVAWLKVWGNVPGINGIDEALALVGQDLYQELQPESANRYRVDG